MCPPSCWRYRCVCVQELKNVLDNCIRLTLLDIRDNAIDATLKELISAIRALLPGLTKLYIERSLRDKDTSKPRDYVGFVFEQMPCLELVDNLRHPKREFDREGRRFKSVFSVFEDADVSGNNGSSGNNNNNNNNGSSGGGGSGGGGGGGGVSVAEVGSGNNNNAVDDSNIGSSSASVSGSHRQADCGSNEQPVYDISMYLSAQYSLHPSALPAPFVPVTSASASAFSTSNFSSDVVASNVSSNPFRTSGNDLYPGFTSFSPESYLPMDYHQTIGRSYDLSLIAQQLAIEVDADNECTPDEDDD